MGHIKLKPSKEFKLKFDPKELKVIKIPEESKAFIREYIKSDKLSDDHNLDMMVMLDDKIIFGFDYLFGKTKRLVIEINPVTVFYANAIMSFGMLQHYRNSFLSQCQDISQIGKHNASID